MSSEVEICNMALGYVGVAHEISSLDGVETEAQQCKRFYAQTRDATLRDFPWPFADKVVALALVASDPNDDWAYSYRYPADCIRAIRFVTGQRVQTVRVPWALSSDASGKLIFTDMQDAVLKYIYKVIDPEMFDPSFVEALAWRLGSKVAIPLSRSIQERDYALKRFMLEMSIAEKHAANEGGDDVPPEAESIRERG